MNAVAAWQFKDEWLTRVLPLLPGVRPDYVEGLRQRGAPALRQAMIRDGVATQADLERAVEKVYGIAPAALGENSSDTLALSLVPERICRRYGLIPLGVSGNTIRVAMSDPLNLVAQSDVEAVSGRAVAPYYACAQAIEAALDRAYDQAQLMRSLLSGIEDSSVSVKKAAEEDHPQDAEPDSLAVRLVNAILARAVAARASDIHIEHEESRSLVRLRVDGELQTLASLPRELAAGPIVSRIKILAGMDPFIHMRPLDGRTRIVVGPAEIALRVSTLPTSYGEKVVMRVLDKRVAQVPFADLGFAPETAAHLSAFAKATQGIVLVTGPTGAGKTTTLYSLLNLCRTETVNVVTVEDPVEYKLDGVNQVQINEKQGLGFGTVLRSVLRQDPDIIMVGEIRDPETADIAFQAAMTGHLVLSTLHTNDALSTVARLMDMGVDRFKLAPSLLGVTSQRLVRRLCPACRVPVEPEALNASIAAELRAGGLPARAWRRGGCARCGNSGYLGRTALVEHLVLDDKIRDLIGAGALEAQIREHALRSGALRTLAYDALWQLSEGATDQAEIMPYISFRATAPRQAPRTAPAAEKPAVLVVDDDENMRLLIKRTLESAGYRVLEARDGREGLALAREGAARIALLDLAMPGMGGHDLIRELRVDALTASLPLIVVSAQADDAAQSLALELGADDYVIKPFSAAPLLARVAAVLRRTGAAQEAKS